MKKPDTLLKKLFIIICCFCVLISCKKNHCDTKASLTADEYIHYTINGTAYNYDMPGDQVMADTIAESNSFLPMASLTGQRIPNISSDFTRIDYSKNNIAAGSLQTLVTFASPQSEIYPYTATSASPVYINITEYGNIGEFISGNFSALITSNAPGNLQYNVTCIFRVKRKI